MKPNLNLNDLHMDAAEFDRMMGKALDAPPPETPQEPKLKERAESRRKRSAPPKKSKG